MSKFSIFKNGKTIFSQNISFSKTENSKIITTNLTSSKEGINYYTATLQKIAGEKNIKNNAKNFFVEVIDQQTKVLILTTILHPDIGTFKRSIESNKQRKVDVFLVSDFKKQINDYQLVVLYQPTNKFKNIFNQIKQYKNNYLLVSGSQTDWGFINLQQLGFTKKTISQTENYSAKYNNSFLTFLQTDIGFHQFPPLKDQFGEVFFTKNHQNLLLQNINGLPTKQPLLTFTEENSYKTAILFGEGIWKWRANSFLRNNSFTEFDQFIGNLSQYLSSKKKRNRLEVNAEKIYPANSNIQFFAFYVDKNYVFDPRASLQIVITNTATKQKMTLPFSLVNNSYQTFVEKLPSGDYTYKVTVLNQNILKYGKFKIIDFQIEKEFTRANSEKLAKLSSKTGGKLFYKDQQQKLIDSLLENSSYYTTQKQITKKQNLIDWRWILFLIVALFSSEWFVRKYFGKI